MNKLPVIPKKQFELKSKFLPNGKVKLIPFTVGLESLLIQAKEGTDDLEKMDAIEQVVQSCIQTPNVAADSLPLFILEEIFIRLRQNSIGELIDQKYQCTNTVAGDNEGEEKPCNNVIPIQIDLREFKVVEEEGHTNTIIISDPIGIKFKYPNLLLLRDSNTSTKDDTETIISCIDSIFDADNVYPSYESTREELLEFWNQLTLPQKKEVYDKFFLSMPHLHYVKEFTCSKCGHKHTLEFNSIKEVFQ